MTSRPSPAPQASLRLFEARLTRIIRQLDATEIKLDARRANLGARIERLAAAAASPPPVPERESLLASLRATYDLLGIQLEQLAVLGHALHRLREDVREILRRLDGLPELPPEVDPRPSSGEPSASPPNLPALSPPPAPAAPGVAGLPPGAELKPLADGAMLLTRGLKEVRLSPRLATLLRLLLGPERMTRQQLRVALATTLGVPISAGCLHNLFYRLRKCLLIAGIRLDGIC